MDNVISISLLCMPLVGEPLQTIQMRSFLLLKYAPNRTFQECFSLKDIVAEQLVGKYPLKITCYMKY